MTYHELVKMCYSVMQTLDRNDVRLEDWQYIDLYTEFKRMQGEGHKWEFIVHYLGEQYNTSAASVYRIVKRMEKPVTLENAF